MPHGGASVGSSVGLFVGVGVGLGVFVGANEMEGLSDGCCDVVGLSVEGDEDGAPNSSKTKGILIRSTAHHMMPLIH